MNRITVKAVLAAVAVLLAGAGAVLAFSNPFARPEKVKAANGVVAISASKIGSGARFFKFEDAGKEITFFVVKGSDGAVHAAFDACDACFREKKGYLQKDDFMVCRNCNQKFAIVRLGNSNKGGCNPGYLPFGSDGRNVTFQEGDLKSGARFF